MRSMVRAHRQPEERRARDCDQPTRLPLSLRTADWQEQTDSDTRDPTPPSLADLGTGGDAAGRTPIRHLRIRWFISLEQGCRSQTDSASRHPTHRPTQTLALVLTVLDESDPCHLSHPAVPILEQRLAGANGFVSTIPRLRARRPGLVATRLDRLLNRPTRAPLVHVLERGLAGSNGFCFAPSHASVARRPWHWWDAAGTTPIRAILRIVVSCLRTSIGKIKRILCACPTPPSFAGPWHLC